jgi:probable HAF family extracellular repeat protein
MRQFSVSTGAALISIYSTAAFAAPAIPDITNFYSYTVPTGTDKDAYGFGVNDLGAIVGEVVDTASGQNGFYFYRGVASEFKYPNAQITVPTTVNDSNVICGTEYQPTGGWSGFCWDSTSGFAAFKVPISGNVSASYTAFNSINSHGAIVGAFQIPGSSNYHGLYTTDRVHYAQLDFPGASNTIASGINDSTQIVGYYQTGNGPHRGFAFAAGQYTDIAIQGCANTIPAGVNNQNDIVGICQAADGTSTSFLRDSAGNIKFFNATGFSSNTSAQSVALNTPRIVGYATQSNNAIGGWVTGALPWPADNSQTPPSVFGTFDWDRPIPDGRKGPDGVPLGDFYQVRLFLQPNGVAAFFIYWEEREDRGEPYTCIIKHLYYYPNGSFNVRFDQLLFTVAGRFSLSDNCNPALDLTVPAHGTFDFAWEEGIALDGTTYLWAPTTGIGHPMNNMLMVKKH